MRDVKQMNRLVSIIVPVYNEERYIKRCLDSVCRQTYSYLEIIVVDDGSTDNSAKICEQCAIIDSRIKVIQKQNEGAGYARNTGIDNAHGDYIFFIDSDDYILDNCIERLLSVAIQEKADIVKCSWIKGREDSYKIYPKITCFSVFDNVSAFRTRKTNIAVHGKLYKREVIGDYRYPKVTTHDDEFFTYKLIYNAHKIIILDEAYYYYFLSPNSIMRGKKETQPLQFMDAYKERISFFEAKNEAELMGISHKEYAIRLMLAFISYNKYRTSVIREEELYKAFCEEYDKGIGFANSFKEIVSLLVFRRFPKILRVLLNR